MPALMPSANPGRFGAWSGGPLTGTVTTPPPSANPAQPPSATAGGYLPQPSAGLPAGGDGGGSADGGQLEPNPGMNPEWGAGASDTSSDGSYGQAIPDKAISTPQGWGGGPGTGGNGAGAGLDGGGGSGPGAGGVMAMDDGGEVPGAPDADGDGDGDMAPTGDQQSQQSVDPMQMIQSALAFGRQQMGMPSSFTQGMQPSDNIEDRRNPLQDANGNPVPGGGAPTPKSGGTAFGGAMRQIRGFADGGEVPMPSGGDDQDQGTGASLPDPRKTMAYLAGAGGVQPDIADALERHVDPQGQMDPAERMLKAVSTAPTPESQFGLLQHYRTRANAYTGAALASMDQGNMVQAAQHMNAVFANTPTGYKVKFAPAHGGLAVQTSKIGSGQQPQQQQGFADGGAVDTDNPAVMMKSYDDGGEVTDDDTDDQGVLPTGGADDSDTPDPGTEPVEQQAAGPPSPGAQDQPTAPVLLPHATVKDLLKSGWDSIVERAGNHNGENGYGLPGLFQQLIGAGARGVVGDVNQIKNGVSNGVGGAVNWLTGNGPDSAPDVGAAVQADQPTPPAPQAGQQGPQQPAPQPRGVQPGDKFANDTRQGRQPASDQQPAGDPQDQTLARLKKQAEAIYGNVINPQVIAQKQAYIQKGMEAAQGNAAKLEQTNAMWNNKTAIANNVEGGKNSRAAQSVSARLNGQTLQALSRTLGTQQTGLDSIAKTLLGDPNFDISSTAGQQKLKTAAAQLGLNPQALMTGLQDAMQGGGQQQQGQGGQQPQGGNAEPMKQYNGKWYTKSQYEQMRAAGVEK